MGVRILVAGGAGFVGSHLVDRLLRRHDISELLVVDNLWTGRLSNLAHIRDARLRVAVADIERVPLDGKYDEIYHLASPASPSAYLTDPVRTISANVTGAMRLLDAMSVAGLLCFTSTSEVYGDPTVSPQPESYRGSVDCTGPRAAYDEAKRCTEALLLQSHAVNGTRVKVVRLFNVFGPRMRQDDGRAVSNFIAQGLRGEPLTIYGDGSNSRSWGYVDDIVDALERYFWRDDVECPGPVNIGNNREIAVVDVARYVIRRHFPELGMTYLPPVAQDPTNRCPDLTLARRLLPGWECCLPYEQGIDRTVDWFAAEFAAEAKLAVCA